MILFDFKCGDCEHKYECFVGKETVVTCPECNSTENQTKVLGFSFGYATNNDSPKTTKDLQNYLGNGQYTPGYKMGS